MTIQEIIETNFFRQFIADYYERFTYSVFPEKDRLFFILYENTTERDLKLHEEIEKLKLKISNLGNEQLSYGYFLTSDNKSPDFISDYNEKESFWIERFHSSYCDQVISVTIVKDNFHKLSELYKRYNKKTEDFDKELWDILKDWKPKETDLKKVIASEEELLDQITTDIEIFKESGFWEFVYKDYLKFQDYSLIIENLFNHCELLVCINRISLLKSFISTSQEQSGGTELDTIWFQVGLLFANGKMDLLLKQFGNNYTKIAKHLNNSNFRPYISETKSANSKSDKNIFHSNKKVRKIFDYCTENQIAMTESFLSIAKKIEI